ncbi:DUF2956 domain-containing protein [Alkalimarinus sediminis]|uniref:DUF2956 domain-containing protein n=1 Tax=Alkalimarinus sediminis TaxID=1632866 RepID=A0A9E8HR75_9ALTE|nr:DUF2956 domain-containing protein [Alkalimarinus sediminis]UZW74294.1 DUF2956 domain-containing protein [Alkalimarinus sediminis]
MAKYSKKQQAVSEKTQEEAMQVARATQKPGQTKEQTKLIAQGIQKGIDHYKKQQKAKSRELNKRLKKAASAKHETGQDNPVEPPTDKASRLPWFLLLASWALFTAYILITRL